LNFVRNAVERKKTYEEKIGPTDIYIYITLENLIDESLIRLYCSISNKDIHHVNKTFADERYVVERTIKEWQESTNSAVIMSYFPPTVTSVADLIVYINEIRNRYKNKGKIKGVYIDYLDLLMAGQKFDLYRLEMGQVVIDLKCLVVKENIPCITLTQLNRSTFLKSRINIKGVGDTTLDQVKIGDYVKRGNVWTKVLKVFPKEKKKCYKIKTRSGKEIICGPKHNFPTTDGLKNIKYTGLKIGDKLFTMEKK
jgi:hypothetical protein